MLEELLSKNEGKTLEFKENTQSLQKIIQTIIAFANTAGGVLLLGIKNETKEIIGLANVLQEEEKIANAIADSVSPLLIPNLQFCSLRERDILIVTVPYSPSLYHLKSKGEVAGTFIRLGSTNRLADAHIIAEIRRLKEHTSFDQLPDCKFSLDDFDFELAKQLFRLQEKRLLKQKLNLWNYLSTINLKLILRKVAFCSLEKIGTSFLLIQLSEWFALMASQKTQLLMNRKIKILSRKRWKNPLPLYAVIPPSVLLSKELDAKRSHNIHL